jgi:WS/DGAT/MGAT family acyltransferase
MERLGPLDAAFLEAEDEDRHTSMAIASVGIFAGPPPSQADFVAAYASRLPLVPRYRQRVRRIPFDLGPPVWADDPHFEIGWHLRRTALPAPGTEAALHELLARLMSQRLDRDRPLWETWVVEGLDGDRWALISKVHHCMVDGVAGTELYHLLLSSTPAIEDLPLVDPSAPPGPAPSDLPLLLDAAWKLGLTPIRQLALVRHAISRPQETLSRLSASARGLLALSGAAVPVNASSLIGPTGQQRRYDASGLRMHDVKRIGKHFGVTVNDVALAVVTAGFRALLSARGEACTPTTVRSLVPVSVRAPGAERELANKVSCLLVDLPVHLDDPVDRLQAVHAGVRRARERGEAVAGAALVEFAEHEPFVAVSPLLRTAFRLPQRSVVTVTTNVPGPRQPLYLLGRQMLRLLPYVPIADGVRLGVAILSYCDELAIGVTADYEHGGGADVLLRAAQRDLRALVSAATMDPHTNRGAEQVASGQPMTRAT